MIISVELTDEQVAQVKADAAILHPNMDEEGLNARLVDAAKFGPGAISWAADLRRQVLRRANSAQEREAVEELYPGAVDPRRSRRSPVDR